ncbi:MAG: thioesterase family protein [Nocardioides sp.]|nr:thioesterase family protein [Nocardioides sp.]
MSFDDAVTAKPESTTPGRYEAQLSDDWSIGAGVNGGFLLALLGNTLRTAVSEAGGSHPDPVSISATYLSAATAGPAYLDTDVIRTGRSVSTGTVALHQVDDGGRPVERLRATATYADLAALANPDDAKRNVSFRTMPQAPPPEECFGNEHTPPQFLEVARMLNQFELRLTPESVGWALGEPSRTGRLSGWFRLPDDREPDPISLLLVVDALPPVTFDLGLPGWAPTLSLTASVRARPAPGWLFVTHATRTMASGLFEEDAEVWDSTGTLVAESRQIAMVPKRR